MYPRALNRRWAIRANGLRARQIRSTAIRPCLFIRDFPLVDFPLAFVRWLRLPAKEAFDFDYRGARPGSNASVRFFFTSDRGPGETARARGTGLTGTLLLRR